MNELALFAGAGGGILGGHLLGWRCVCAVEYDAYAASVLLARQNDGCLPAFPIWDDVRTFDGRPWRGLVDVVSGGFPCQDISSAGGGAGITGERSGLWQEMARIISEVRPRYILVENSPMLTVRGLGVVLGRISEMGYNAAWGVLGAKHAGLPHNRLRIWIVADNNAQRGDSISGRAAEILGNVVRHVKVEPSFDRIFQGMEAEGKQCSDKAESCLPSYLCRVDDELAGNVERLERIGNGQVPAVASLAWNILSRP